MDKISLASYLLKFKSKDDGKSRIFENYDDQYNLFDFEHQKKDFLIDLKNFLEDNKEFTDNIKQKDLEIDDVNCDNRMCYGTAFYGSFGKYWKAKNIRNKKEDHMDSDTAPEEPFYYLFYFPKNSDKAIAIFERKGTVGMKDVFERFLYRELFIPKISGFELDFTGYLPKEVVLEYIKNGEILALNFLDIPSHKKNKINRINPNLDKIRGKISLKLKVEKNYKDYAKKFINELMGNKSEFKGGNDGFLSIDEINTDNTKVDIKLGKMKRSFYVSGENAYPYMDITDEVEIDDGHPEFEDIHRISKEYAKELIKK